MQVAHSNGTTTRSANNRRLWDRWMATPALLLLWPLCFFLLSVPVGDFQQPFEINVELKGVGHDATEVQINKMHQKSRKLHCSLTVGPTANLCFSLSMSALTPPRFRGVCNNKIEALLKQRRADGANAESRLFILHFQKCDEVIVLHLGYLNYTGYRVKVSFRGLENITHDIHVRFVVSYDVGFHSQTDCEMSLHLIRITCSPFLVWYPSQWKTYNQTFSQVEIWFRFVFVVLTFMVTVRTPTAFRTNRTKCASPKRDSPFPLLTFQCMFAHSLRKFSMRDWGIEQKWMSILLPLLLLYNGKRPCYPPAYFTPIHHSAWRTPPRFDCYCFVDCLLSVLVFSDPFFPLSFLVNSWFPGTLDAFFQALFLSSLLLFWLCVYHGIRVQVASRLMTFFIFLLLQNFRP